MVEPLPPYAKAMFITSAATYGLMDFASRLIRHCCGGGALDDEAIASIRGQTLFQAKNAEARSIPLQEEAETLRQGVELLTHFLDGAISGGKSD